MQFIRIYNMFFVRILCVTVIVLAYQLVPCCALDDSKTKEVWLEGESFESVKIMGAENGYGGEQVLSGGSLAIITNGFGKMSVSLAPGKYYVWARLYDDLKKRGNWILRIDGKEIGCVTHGWSSQSFPGDFNKLKGSQDIRWWPLNSVEINKKKVVIEIGDDKTGKFGSFFDAIFLTPDPLCIPMGKSSQEVVRISPDTQFGLYGEIDSRAAEYDFAVFQTMDQDILRGIKKTKPAFKAIYRLPFFTHYSAGKRNEPDAIEYYYSDKFRNYFQKEKLLNPISDVADLLYAVTLNEEEPAHQIYGDPQMNKIKPYIAGKWSEEFKNETGISVQQASTEQITAWVGPKILFFFNDCYRVIKEKYPKLKIYQWTVGGGDETTRGTHRFSGAASFRKLFKLSQLKLDGYVLQYYSPYQGPDFTDSLKGLQERGVPMDEINSQVWSKESESGNQFGGCIVNQVAQCVRSDVNMIWNFSFLSGKDAHYRVFEKDYLHSDGTYGDGLDSEAKRQTLRFISLMRLAQKRRNANNKD